MARGGGAAGRGSGWLAALMVRGEENKRLEEEDMSSVGLEMNAQY